MDKLTKQQKRSFGILILLLISLGILLAITTKRPTGPLRDFNTNVIVQQRIKNIENNR